MNEKRLIDVNALVEWLKDVDVFFKGTTSHKTMAINLDRIIDHIEAMPTVDAEPVVRCKDCKHYQYYVFLDDGKFCCRMKTGSGKVAWYPRFDDDYCSYAERKDDE